MTGYEIALLAVGLLVGLLATGVPIGVCLGISAFTGMILVRGVDATVSLVAASSYDFVAHWSLSAIPMFIFMGAIAFFSGLTGTLFAAARAWLNFLPGGLAIATNVSSAGFAAASGSSVAMAAAMTRVAVPEMLRAGYNPGLATGIVAASGTLGAFIPPSIPFVLYAVFMEASVGQLLIAGIVPGLLTMLGYSMIIMVRCTLNPALAPREDTRVPWSEKLRLLVASWPLPVIVCGVVGGIYSGIVSATEAGAFGAIVALVAAALQRTLSWGVLWDAVVDTIGSTGRIFVIAIGAVLFSKMLTLTQVPFAISMWLEANDLQVWQFMAIVTLFYILLGMFLDPVGLMLVTLPILQPFVISLDINLIWFGVLVVKFIEIGLLTPPIGLNLFVVAAATDGKVPLGTIIKGVSWFLIAEVFILAALMFFPALSLWLPGKL